MKSSDLIILLIILGGCFVVWQMMGGNMSNKQTKKRIDRIKQRRIGVMKTAQESSLRRKVQDTKGIVNWLMKPLPDFKQLGDRLTRAGKTITPKQFVFRRIIYTLGILFVFCIVLGKPLVLGVPLAAIVGVWLPFKLLARTIDKEKKAFLRLFPDALDLIVRGLRSGLPVSESLVLVSQEIPKPVGTMFTEISNTMKLGVPMEKALLEMARKLDMTEFNFFTTSIVLQRETGGNLSEILNNLSEVLRTRYLMRMKIKALSSEARASAYIIGALPFVVFLAVSVISPDYMQPLFHDYRGNICLGTAAGMMTFGGWIMSKMTRFEI